MKHRSKLSQEQQHIEAHESQQQTGREFASAEELLRFDAAQTSVPPEIAEHLKRTIHEVAPPERPNWLKRMFRKKSL
jgi:hypothetical protein